MIFHIIHSNIKGGMENVYLDYAKILQTKFRIICIVPKNFPYLSQLQAQNIQTETLNIHGHYDILSAIRLFFLIKKYSPKLLIAHNGRSFATINLCKKFFNTDILKTMAISHGGQIKRILSFDYIITIAKHLEKNIKDKKFNGQLSTIYNGIKTTPHKNTKKKHHDFTFGILSRFSPEKNILTAIKSFKKFIQESSSNAKLIIAGDGEDYKMLQDFIQNNQLEHNISLIGWITNKETFFNQIDILLLPSTSESFGLSILDAFNYHTVVIAANIAGPAEIIQHKYNGYLYNNPLSVNNLYNIMNYTFHNQNNFSNIIQNAYCDLEKKFSLDTTEKKLLSLINNILKKHK